VRFVRWSGLCIAFWAVPLLAQTDAERIKQLEAKTEALAAELAELRAQLHAEPSSDHALETLRVDVDKASQIANEARQAASEWRNTTSVSHIAGYAAAGYTSERNGTDAFNVANFNPIFHFVHGDKILWESEMEVEVEEDGSTDVALEYSSIDIFLNDYLILAAGKFISPIGNFRQNLHPSWINKLPSVPPGFGHDGAAPSAEVGLELRGVLPFGSRRKFTYAGYVGNGPILEGEDGELHGIDTEGFASDEDNEKVVGGRISLLPMPNLELALSGAFGNAAVVGDGGNAVQGDPTRRYRVFGADFSYQWQELELRGEYVQQDIGDAAASVVPEGAKWETWYLQGSYKFAQAKWEGVVRYGDFDAPHAVQSQKQWSMGLNYLMAPHAIVKLAYELNDGLMGEETDNDRWLMQLAYGF